ncbi:50S ribosomal protein L9 [Pelagibacteraceae bacterium]|nr:50S ribosomal protein L9 [Pelagibacteraceae bacterium]|tara:strand:- start:93 stop:551 length:459 start_codon:yes stop_codon:yes gene_type:complete
MNIILLENIYKLGKIGDQVKVKNGYGRNYLLSKGKALVANKENIDLTNKKKDELNKKDLEEKKRFQEIASKINKKMIIFKKEAKENGDLYASIKPKEISNYIQSNFKIDIKPSEIVLKQDLKIIGNFEIDINLHFEVTAKVKIQIKKLDDLR